MHSSTALQSGSCSVPPATKDPRTQKPMRARGGSHRESSSPFPPAPPAGGRLGSPLPATARSRAARPIAGRYCPICTVPHSSLLLYYLRHVLNGGKTAAPCRRPHGRPHSPRLAFIGWPWLLGEKQQTSLKQTGYAWSYLACRTGHAVPIWQPSRLPGGSSARLHNSLGKPPSGLSISRFVSFHVDGDAFASATARRQLRDDLEALARHVGCARREYRRHLARLPRHRVHVRRDVPLLGAHVTENEDPIDGSQAGTRCPVLHAVMSHSWERKDSQDSMIASCESRARNQQCG
jgi:hypothetical protein